MKSEIDVNFLKYNSGIVIMWEIVHIFERWIMNYFQDEIWYQQLSVSSISSKKNFQLIDKANIGQMLTVFESRW